MSGGVAVIRDYQVIVPCTDDQLRANVIYSNGLHLPDVEGHPVREEPIYLYANGPSAADAPILWPSMALNGALQMFMRRGSMPNYWAACDPGEVVGNFLRSGAHVLDGFLVASKCAPIVFDRLRWHAQQGRVKRWHIDDAGADALDDKTLMPSAISVTISAIFLLYHMGYRKVVTYGWDGSYSADGRDHAIGQGHDTTHDVDVDLGGKMFRSTDTWLAELEDAAEMLNRLPDVQLTIQGEGLFATALKPILDHMNQTQRRSNDASSEERAARAVRAGHSPR